MLAAIMAFNCTIGSYALTTFSKKMGKYPNELANLSILLSRQKISTGSEILRIPLPDRMFRPILFIINVNTFFCYLIFA